MVSDKSSLKSHRLFGSIIVGIPENVSRQETNMDVVEEMGFAYFASKDEKVEITVRKMEGADLSQAKSLMDNLSKSLYNGTIVTSEIIKVNGIDFFVTDIKGQWNGAGEVIGMFRYYFNAKGNSYNLLMRYPADMIDKTRGLKDEMLQSIKIVE